MLADVRLTFFFSNTNRTGLEPKVTGITEEDYASGKVRRTTEAERAAIQADVIGTSDADDLRVLRTPGPYSESSSPDKPRRRFVSKTAFNFHFLFCHI